MEKEGSKLQEHHENPIDIGFINIAKAVSPALHKVGATPNMITTLSVIASYLAVRSIYLGQPKRWFILWAFLAYMFDCIDGYFARKYDMCTVFGDYYDHISDVVYMSLLLYVAFWKRGLNTEAKKYKWLIALVFIIVGLGALIHIGIQENIYVNNQQSPTLKICSTLARKVCKIAEKCAPVSRFCGIGTFFATMILLIVLTVR